MPRYRVLLGNEYMEKKRNAHTFVYGELNMNERNLTSTFRDMAFPGYKVTSRCPVTPHVRIAASPKMDTETTMVRCPEELDSPVIIFVAVVVAAISVRLVVIVFVVMTVAAVVVVVVVVVVIAVVVVVFRVATEDDLFEPVQWATAIVLKPDWDAVLLS
jgi:hypothetical protein